MEQKKRKSRIGIRTLVRKIGRGEGGRKGKLKGKKVFLMGHSRSTQVMGTG